MRPTQRTLHAQPLVDVLADLGRKEAADTLGVDRSTVENWVKGKRVWISEDRADRYAVALGMHPASIWGDAWWAIPTLDEMKSAQRARERARRTELRKASA